MEGAGNLITTISVKREQSTLLPFRDFTVASMGFYSPHGNTAQKTLDRTSRQAEVDPAKSLTLFFYNLKPLYLEMPSREIADKFLKALLWLKLFLARSTQAPPKPHPLIPLLTLHEIMFSFRHRYSRPVAVLFARFKGSNTIGIYPVEKQNKEKTERFALMSRAPNETLQHLREDVFIKPVVSLNPQRARYQQVVSTKSVVNARRVLSTRPALFALVDNPAIAPHLDHLDLQRCHSDAVNVRPYVTPLTPQQLTHAEVPLDLQTTELRYQPSKPAQVPLKATAQTAATQDMKAPAQSPKTCSRASRSGSGKSSWLLQWMALPKMFKRIIRNSEANKLSSVPAE
eukprot:g7295.t1